MKLKTGLSFLLIIFTVLVINSKNVFADVDEGWGLISEIAFDDSGDDWSSWLEIYVLEDTNIEGSRLYHRHNLSGDEFEHAFTFPDVDVEEGDYLIVEFNVEHGDSHQTTTAPRVFYSTYPDRGDNAPFSTQGALYLTEPDGSVWSDAVMFFAERATTFHMDDEYDMFVSSGFWSPAADAGWGTEDYREVVPGGEGSSGQDGMSLQRINDYSEGRPENTNTVDDWEFAPTTRGYGYVEIEPVQDLLRVENSPFFPHESIDPAEARISYRNSEDKSMRTTIKIFDTDGYAVRTLLRYESIAPGEWEFVTWNGEDEYGDILPMGIYIVHIMMEPGDGGDIEQDQAPVVIGRDF